MFDIKSVAKTMTLEAFNLRFIEEVQGVRDIVTDKIYFCPVDLGFNVTFKNCVEGLKCRNCWSQAKKDLEFKEILKEIQKEITEGETIHDNSLQV